MQRQPTHLNTQRKQYIQDIPSATPKLTYADVVATRPAAVGGYTTSSNEEATGQQNTRPPPSRIEHSVQTVRPQRNRQPPARYGNYITH